MNGLRIKLNSFLIVNKWVLAFSLLILFGNGLKASKTIVKDSLLNELRSPTLNDSTRFDIHQKLIISYKYRGDIVDSLLSQNILLSDNNKWNIKRIETLFRRSIYYNKFPEIVPEYKETLDEMDSLIKSLADFEDSKLYLFKAYANFHFKQRGYDIAEDYLKKALEEADRLGLEHKKAAYYNEIALNQKNQGKYIESIDNYLKALEYPNVKKSYTYSNLGRLHAGMLDHQKQIEFAEKGIIAAQEEKNLPVEITCRLDIGRAYYWLGRIDEAEDYLKSTLPTIANSTVSVRKMIVDEYLLRIHNSRGDWNKTLSLEEEIMEHPKNWSFGFIATQLGIAYMNTNDFSNAKKWCEWGKEIGLATEKPTYILEPCECLTQLYQKIGDHKKAYQNLSLVSEMKELKNDKQKYIDIANGLSKKDVNSKLAIAALENQAQQRAYQQKLRISQLSGIFLSLIGILGFLFFLQSRRKNKEIASQNSIIIKANEEKDILLKEVNHRVKNNLQLLSSIFSLQLRNTNDPSQIKLLKENKGRLQALSYVYEDLYENDDLSKNNVQDVIKRLLQLKIADGQLDEENLKLELSPIFLDTRTNTPIILIFNELIDLNYDNYKDHPHTTYISVIEQSDNLILKFNYLSDKASNIEGNTKFTERLIKAFAQKLRAEYSMTTNKGLEFNMTITNYKNLN